MRNTFLYRAAGILVVASGLLWALPQLIDIIQTYMVRSDRFVSVLLSEDSFEGLAALVVAVFIGWAFLRLACNSSYHNTWTEVSAWIVVVLSTLFISGAILLLSYVPVP